MGKESTLWRRFKTVFGSTGHWVRIENDLQAGTPDVNGRQDGGGADIWLELKHTHYWPKRSTTPVRLPHLTGEQIRWLVRRGVAGGQCGILWQIEHEYFLFGWWSVPYLGNLDRAELMLAAIWHDDTLSSLLQRGIQIKRRKI